jgi:hypothetical protein
MEALFSTSDVSVKWSHIFEIFARTGFVSTLLCIQNLLQLVYCLNNLSCTNRDLYATATRRVTHSWKVGRAAHSGGRSFCTWYSRRPGAWFIGRGSVVGKKFVALIELFQKKKLQLSSIRSLVLYGIENSWWCRRNLLEIDDPQIDPSFHE